MSNFQAEINQRRISQYQRIAGACHAVPNVMPNDVDELLSLFGFSPSSDVEIISASKLHTFNDENEVAL